MLYIIKSYHYEDYEIPRKLLFEEKMNVGPDFVEIIKRSVSFFFGKQYRYNIYIKIYLLTFIDKLGRMISVH